jgi:hypothetical protein
MSDTHRDRSDYYPGTRERDADLGDMETLALMQEVRSLARDMTIAIINSHREERNKRLAREKYDRLHTAMTIVYNRQFDIIIEKDDEIAHLKEALDIRNDEYDALRDRLDRELPMWEADQLAIRLLKKRIARMKIQNWMRQIRPLNPPPLVPPIAPLPQQIDQICLLFH